MPRLRPVQPHQQFHQRGFPGARWPHKRDGFAAGYSKRDLAQGRRRGRLVLKRDVVKLQRLQEINGNGMLRTRLRRQFQDRLEILQRDFRLAIHVDHVAQFLQRAEDEERIDEQRKELSHA